MVSSSPELFPQSSPEPSPDVGGDSSAAGPAASSGRVLIADNDAAVNSLLESVLVEEGLECVTVHDGEQALERLRQGGIDVLVTDLDMPKLDGHQLLARLAEFDTPPAALVISGYLDPGVEASLQRQPVVHQVLHKPFDVLAFAELVSTVIAARRATAGTL